MFEGQDARNFILIVEAVITQEDFVIEDASEDIVEYLKEMETIGTLTLVENEEGVVEVTMNKQLPKIFGRCLDVS